MNLIYLKSALKCNSFDASIIIKIPFLEFQILLSRVAPYYSLLPRTVWFGPGQKYFSLIFTKNIAKFVDLPCQTLYSVIEM